MSKELSSPAFGVLDLTPPLLDSPPDAEGLRSALRLLAGGVTIITAGEGDDRTGATVTSATGLSVDPPRMLVSLNHTSSTWPVVERYGHFCVNLVGPHHQALANQFAGRGGLKGPERYRGAEWTRLASGAPVLDDAIAAVDCVVEEVLPRHGHVLVIGKVAAIRSRGGQSLGYCAGRYVPIPESSVFNG